jgi:hypothetical protein
VKAANASGKWLAGEDARPSVDENKRTYPRYWNIAMARLSSRYHIPVVVITNNNFTLQELASI